jgi:uncharacterized membrane protein YfcA
MDGAAASFLGMAGVDGWIFAGLAGMAMVTAFISSMAGAAGGLVLLATMAMVFPPVLLIPLHTVVQLGASVAMVSAHWRHMMRETVLPFALGVTIGAALGGRIFISLPEAALQAILGISILVLAWVPRFARFGPVRGRFVFVGFLTTFLGMFISATGTLVGAFTSAHAPDRHNHIATLGGLMFIVHVAKLVAFGLLGVHFGSYAPLLAAMIAMSFVGTWIAKMALQRTPERMFRLAFRVILTVLALRLLWIAAGALG